MKYAGRLACIVLSVIVAGWTQDTTPQPQRGAKAIFYDSTTDATVHAEKAGSTQRNAAKPSTGLKYWVELVQPSGQVLRVNSNRVFHSGEHIRLHFESNIDGKIVLVQMNGDGTSQLLYPDPRINHGDSHIKAGDDMTVPAGGSWFTLDNNPGTERLMVFLNADTAVPATHHNAGGNQTHVSESANPTVGRALSSSPDGKLDASTTAALAGNVAQEQGSKSLVLEIDEKSEAPAEYVVKTTDYRRGSSAVQPALATMIQLHHQ